MPASALPQPQSSAPCPCGSGQPYGTCCEPLLRGERRPDTAEQLMRSRFTAHVAHDYSYLHRTYRPTSKLPYVEEASDGSPPIAWTRLVVHAHEPGAVPDIAHVDFSAYFAEESGERAIHEKAEFRRVDGQWLYTRPLRTGPAPAKAAAKVGRNEPCPCGSGKKFKQCCGR